MDTKFPHLTSQDELESSDIGRSPRFPPGSGFVLACILSVVIWMIIGAVAFAQTSSGAVSGSAASNRNINAAGSVSSGNSIVLGAAPANTRSTTEYQGSYRVESAPSVSAPAVFGGGHPCLAGKSGGVSVVGGGFSYGQGDPEPACMAWIMGQPEIALNIMAGSSPRFLRATCNVGFWRVGNAKIPVNCDNRGRPIATVSTKAQVAPVAAKTALLSKCEKTTKGIKVRYTAAGKKDKATANAQCISHLGM